MHASLQNFLASITSLHQLEPKNLPKNVLHVMLQMSPEELFKTCSQLAILKHNIPSKDKNITLTEDEIAQLAENYLKEIIMIFKWGF